MTTGQLEARVTADTSGLQAGMVQAAVVTEAQMRRIAQYVKAANDQQARIGQTVQASAATASKAYSTVADGAEKMRSSHAGVNRELLVLAHELSQGNYSRFGGSMLVLAERTNALEFAMSGAGAATLGLGAALLGAVALIAKGAIDADHFAKALQLTGNYAAVSETQVAALAEAQAKITGATVGSSRESIEAVAGSGLFGQQSLTEVSRAITDYRRLTGAGAEDALKVFERMKDGASEWAADANRSFHFATVAQYDHIKALQDAGQADAAAAEAAKLLADSLEGRGTPAVGLFARAWRAVKDAASDAMQALEDIGRPADKVIEAIGKIDRQIAIVKQANTANPAAASEMLDALQEQRRILQQQESQANSQRSDTARQETIQQAAIQARKYTDEVVKAGKAQSALNDELKKFHDAAEALAKAGSPLSDEDIKKGEEGIRKRFADHTVTQQADEYRSLMATVKAFNDTTDEEASRMGKLTEGQRFVIQVQEQLTKSGKALTAAQRDQIKADAQRAAAARDVADAEVRALSAAMARVQADTANAQAQQSLVEGVIGAGNDQATALLRKVSLIGKSTQDALKLQELQKFDDVIGKALLGADADTVKRIQEVAAVMRTDLVGAIDATKAAQDAYNASFSNGAKDAMRDYVDQAKNNADKGRQFFDDATKGMSDAIVQFAETGKLSFSGLIDSMISDLIRFSVEKGIAGLFGDGGGISTAISFLAGSGDWGGAPAHANGLSYVPYDGYPAILHEGERVLTKQDAAMQRSSAAGTVVDASIGQISVGQGVSRAEVHAAVRQAQGETEMRMRRLMRTGSMA
jgi:lambda family phage tail tape measure protein